MTENLIEVRGVSKEFTMNDSFVDRLFGSDKPLRAVDDVSFDVKQGEILGLVGESGSGKSTLAKTVTKIHDPTEGSIKYRDAELASLSNKEMKEYRTKMAIIFQDPGSSLNRSKTAAQIIKYPMEVHGLYEGERDRRVNQLMDRVGLPPRLSNRYPHEFSGGQKQRIGIARALAVDPEFIVADEPVSALDVSIQAQILNLLRDLQMEYDLTMLFIAHDLSVIKHIADRVAVMYLGEIVEMADVDDLFGDFRHPYTEALLQSIPEPIPEKARNREVLEGEMPSPVDPPSGCSFHSRCPHATEECATTDPALRDVEAATTEHRAACIRTEEIDFDHSIVGTERDYDGRYEAEEFPSNSATPR